MEMFLEPISNLSHKIGQPIEEEVALIRKKISERGDLPYATMEKQLQLLDELLKIELSRFLIQSKGLNGFWTDFIVNGCMGIDQSTLGDLERFLYYKAPVVLATRERYHIFQSEMQKRVREAVSLCSVPSGLMSDLLNLDYSSIEYFQLTGYDIDPLSLQAALYLAQERGLENHAQLLLKDAWKIQDEECFDVITSNGLNIYEPDDSRCLDLYTRLFRALKPGGVLITSYLSPPPFPGTDTEWNMKEVNLENVLLQKTILSDIIGVKWQVYRSKEQTLALLRQAGFDSFEVVFDKAHMFPTVVASKN